MHSCAHTDIRIYMSLTVCRISKANFSPAVGIKTLPLQQNGIKTVFIVIFSCMMQNMHISHDV